MRLVFVCSLNLRYMRLVAARSEAGVGVLRRLSRLGSPVAHLARWLVQSRMPASAANERKIEWLFDCDTTWHVSGKISRC